MYRHVFLCRPLRLAVRCIRDQDWCAASSCHSSARRNTLALWADACEYDLPQWAISTLGGGEF
jgi:predicted CxxxxCH...CXXCH cytochrome family protein